MGDLRRVGRVGLKSLIYFETVSTVALAVGLLVGEVLQPGHGFNIDPATIDPKSVATYVTKAKEEGIVAHLMAIIPDSYLRRHRARRPAAGAADLDPLGLRHRLSRQGRRADCGRDRQGRQDVLRHHPHHRARRADRRLRRHGVHRRRLRPRLAAQPRGADRHVLSDQHAVRADRAGRDRAARRLLDPALHRLYQGRAADRARHLVLRRRCCRR